MSQKAEFGLAIHGATGRMGQEILKLAQQDSSWLRITAVARNGWEDVPASNVDAVIDFSSPAGFTGACDWCVRNGKPLVSGTTGFSDGERRQMNKAAEKIPLLWSANMSLGVHVLAKAMESFQKLSDWDFQVDEIHHRTKKDHPSGTALMLQSKLEKMLGRPAPQPLSARGGGVIGVHRVLAMSEEEMLIFEHQALSRAVFARGALTAARWLLKTKAKAKLYAMADVLSDL